jgi:hypothetical protein
MTPRPDVPLSTGEIARLLGWSTKRTARWLDGLAAKDASIIVRVRGRRRVTLASLRRVCPDIGKRFPTDRDLEEIRDTLAEQRVDLNLVAERLREFQRESSESQRRMAMRMNAAEKALREAQRSGRKRTDKDAA